MKEQANDLHQVTATNDGEPQDSVWDTAWAWVRRQYANDSSFDAAAQRELVQWLAADGAHRKNYDKACQLWLLAGLVPPVNDVPIPGCDDSAQE